MKKLGLLSIILVCLFLVGCGKMSQEEIFEKNLECQKLLDKFKEDWNLNVNEDGYYVATYNFTPFYSPSEHNCLCAYEQTENFDGRRKRTYVIKPMLPMTSSGSWYARSWKDGEEDCNGNSQFKNERYLSCISMGEEAKIWEEEIKELQKN